MAQIVTHLSSPSSSSSLLHHSFSTLPKLRFPTLLSCRPLSSSSSSSSAAQMTQQGDKRPKFKDFPYASSPIKDLMVELVTTLETRLGSQLIPCTLPQDVQYFQNQSGTSHGSLFLGSGAPTSPIDLIAGSWLHCELPTGAALNITSLFSYMNDSSDAPQLVIEFLQSSPSYLVVFLDLPHRRDLVLDPDYLKTFYEDSGLEKQRQLLYEINEVQPYISPSLYIRSLSSPTAVVVRIDTTATGGECRLEEIVRDKVSAAAKEVLRIWFDLCVFGERGSIGDADRDYLKKRDIIIKQKSIEMDIGTNLPRTFGQEIADRIMGVLRDV